TIMKEINEFFKKTSVKTGKTKKAKSDSHTKKTQSKGHVASKKNSPHHHHKRSNSKMSKSKSAQKCSKTGKKGDFFEIEVTTRKDASKKTAPNTKKFPPLPRMSPTVTGGKGGGKSKGNKTATTKPTTSQKPGSSK